MTAIFQPFPMLAGRRAQLWRHQPSFRRPRHFHDEPELNFIARGHATFGVGDHVLSASQNDVLFFHPGQDHAMLNASDDLELFVLAITKDLSARACEGVPKIRTMTREVASCSKHLARQLTDLQHVVDASAIENQLVDLFQRLSNPAGRLHILTRRALEEVHANPSLSESILARRFGVVPSSISRSFRHDLGMTLVEYRARIRLMHFIRSVDRGEPFLRAALTADFGSYAQCHRVFRRLLGCSPRAYFDGARQQVDALLFATTTSNALSHVTKSNVSSQAGLRQ